MTKSAQTTLGGMKKSSTIKVPKQHWGGMKENPQ